MSDKKKTTAGKPNKKAKTVKPAKAKPAVDASKQPGGTIKATDMARQMGIEVLEFNADWSFKKPVETESGFIEGPGPKAPASEPATALVPASKPARPWNPEVKAKHNAKRLELQAEALELVKQLPGHSLKIKGLVVQLIDAGGLPVSAQLGFTNMVNLLKGRIAFQS